MIFENYDIHLISGELGAVANVRPLLITIIIMEEVPLGSNRFERHSSISDFVTTDCNVVAPLQVVWHSTFVGM